MIISLSTASFAQLGGLKDKIKDKTKDAPKDNPKTDDSKKSNDTGTPTAQKKVEKDADGYIINDSEVNSLFDGKKKLFTTDIRLFASIFGTANPFKMAGAAIVTENDSELELLIVGQKKYGGVYKANEKYSKGAHGFWVSSSASNPYYASKEGDGSLLLFDNRTTELISNDEARVKEATEDALKKLSAPYLAKIKEGKAAEDQAKKFKENETFYKNGGVKASKTNPALESQFLKVLNDANQLATVPANEKASYNKVKLIADDWVVEKNHLDQPVKMVYSAWAEGSYTANKNCFFQKVYFKKEYTGGGQYGPVKFDEAQKPSVIGCELMK